MTFTVMALIEKHLKKKLKNCIINEDWTFMYSHQIFLLNEERTRVV